MRAFVEAYGCTLNAGESHRLTRLRFSVALRKNGKWVGRPIRALVAEPGKPGTTILRTDECKKLVIPGKVKLGEWHVVRVIRATPTYLKGLSEGFG